MPHLTYGTPEVGTRNDIIFEPVPRLFAKPRGTRTWGGGHEFLNISSELRERFLWFFQKLQVTTSIQM